jgi:hypothetical protein
MGIGWDFSIRDRASAAANKIAASFRGIGKSGADSIKSLSKAEEALGKVEAQLKKLERSDAIEKLQKKLAKADPNSKKGKKLGLQLEKVKLEDKKADLSEKADAAAKRTEKLKTEMTAGATAAQTYATAVGAVALVVGGLAVAGGKLALDALAFKQSTQFALKYSLGGAEKAAESYGYAQNIARVLGDSARGLAGQMQELVRDGFGAGDAQTIAQLGADLKAMNGGKEVQMSGLISTFKSLQKQGYFDNAALDAVIGALPAQGQFGGKVVETLAAKLGIQEKDARLREQKVRAQLGQNQKLRGQKGVDALFETVLAVSGEKKIGAAAKSFADTTVEGSLTKVKSRFENLFDSMKADGPGKAVIGLLNKVSDALDTDTPAGKKTVATLEKMAATAGQLIDKFDVGLIVDGLGLLEDGIAGVLPYVDALGGGLLQGMKEAGSVVVDMLGVLSKGNGGDGNKLADSLRNIAIGAGYLVVGVGTAIGAVLYLGAKIAGVAAFIAGAAGSIGLALVDGIVGGLDSAKSKLVERLESLAQLLPDSVRKLLKIQSPSKVFAEIGANVSLGLARGIDREAPEAQASARAILSPELGPGGEGGARRFGRAGPVTIVVNINGGQNARETADQVVREVVDVLEQLGLASGAVGATT